MRAALDDPALLHHQDQVGTQHGGKPVRDDDGRAPASARSSARCTAASEFGVQMRRGLIQHHQVRRLQQQPRNGEPLLLAAREAVAALAHHGVQALGKRLDRIQDLRIAQRFADLFVTRLGPRIEQVRAQRVVEQMRLLRHHADALLHGLQRGVAHVHAVEAHRAGAARRTAAGSACVIVVLPAPEGPTSATSFPGSMLKSMSCSTVRGGALRSGTAMDSSEASDTSAAVG